MILRNISKFDINAKYEKVESDLKNRNFVIHYKNKTSSNLYAVLVESQLFREQGDIYVDINDYELKIDNLKVLDYLKSDYYQSLSDLFLHTEIN